MKAVSETWVVAKTANGREFYAIFNQPGANVLDIDGKRKSVDHEILRTFSKDLFNKMFFHFAEELRKLADAQLTNIFFQD